ncbi:MAG TPA: VWA domain-containing protein [Terriglobales bacterium]|nr:VWA domain-containing protein [Terriglobales bacterium]
MTNATTADRKPSAARSRALTTLPSALLLLLALAPARGAAQELPGARIHPVAPAAKPQQQAGKPPQVPTIIANADLVNMVFSVEGKHGSYVPNLGEGDFRVLEDGRPQRVQFFSLEDQVPLTLGLLLDTSPSQAGILGEEQQISDNFFRQVITPKDLAFVIGFDVDTSLLQDLTPTTARLSAAVDHAHIGGGDAAGSIVNPGPFPSRRNAGATHLWDAIYLACHDELAHQVGRKAIIVVTDGGEQGSSYTDQDALRAALDSNTIVFAVIASDPRFGGYGGFIGPGPGQLAKIAQQTGGRTIRAGNHLAQAFDQIQRELRSQYTLGYRSDQRAHDGRFRAVKIELAPAATQGAAKGAKVRARTGYFAPGPGH